MSDTNRRKSQRVHVIIDGRLIDTYKTLGLAILAVKLNASSQRVSDLYYELNEYRFGHLKHEDSVIEFRAAELGLEGVKPKTKPKRQRKQSWWVRHRTQNVRGVFMITNVLNGKRLIGYSVNMPNRWKGIQSALRIGRGNPLLQEDYDNCNVAFKFEVLALVAKGKDLPARAAEFIEQLKPEYNGQN